MEHHHLGHRRRHVRGRSGPLQGALLQHAAARKRAGFGLSVVDGIVTQSGGSVAILSTPMRGTAVTISIPAIAKPALDLSSAAATPIASKPMSPTALVVEDEPAVKRVLMQTLRKSGYEAWEAASGEEALALLDSKSTVPEIAIVDFLMPGMTGEALRRRLLEKYPGLPVLMM